MNCFECVKGNDSVPAVAICQHCGVGLCFDHLIEASQFSVGGTHEGCAHQIPRVRPLPGVPSRIAEPARHQSAGVA